jgi:O-antigen/teichoic acid export membrane protein
LETPTSPAPGPLDRARAFWTSLNAAYRQAAPPAILNVVSSGVRAATRAGWSLFVPYFLPVDSYGVYSVFQTTATAVTQAAVLGTPQTILREPNRELPMLGLFLHSLSIALVVLLVMALTIARYNWLFQILVAGSAISMILYLQFTMRAKSRFQFARVLRAESIGTAVFVAGVLGIGIAAWSFGRGWVDYSVMGGVEILATTAIVIGLLTGHAGRLTPAERSVRETRRFLPSVYSVGIVVLFDVIIWRRLEVYFLQQSPAGLQGVAVFGLATQLANVYLLVPGAMIEAWGPSFAKSYGVGTEEFFETLRAKLSAYRKLYALFVVGSIALTPFFILTVFHKYVAWKWYVTGFVATRVVCSYAGFHSATMYASRRERLLYAPVVIAAVIAIGSNLLLTLRWGIPGAIVAYGLTQLAVAVGTMIMSHRSRARMEAAQA